MVYVTSFVAEAADVSIFVVDAVVDVVVDVVVVGADVSFCCC